MLIKKILFQGQALNIIDKQRRKWKIAANGKLVTGKKRRERNMRIPSDTK